MSAHGLNNLRFVDYSVNLGSVPSKFDIPSDILILSNSVIPSHDFKLEKEIVAKADKTKAAAEVVKQKAEEEEKKAKQEQMVKAQDEQQAKQQQEQQAKQENEVKESPPDDSPLLDLDFDDVPATSTKVTTPAESKPITPITAEPDHDTLVSMMINETKQDRDVCYFYLESADWNLENAIELLKSMQAISN